ncbi:MAG: hypothetical protein Tsb0020_47820 [Haliangiales bacterium]
MAAGEVGAVIVFGRNLAQVGAGDGARLDVDALCRLTQALHDAASADDPPLWIAIDQEGGSVQRVRAPATVWPPMLRFDQLAAGDDAELATAIGRALGSELAALGIDVDFAPVFDVHTNPDNPVIGARAFGRTPEAVARRALAFADGLAQAGVLSCGKHFPGHGDTDTDSHLALPYLAHDRERLEAVELAPFRAAAAAGVPMLMTAHVVFSAFAEPDPSQRALPATLSPAIITGLLREQIGYQGLIVSDDLDMRAIAAHPDIDSIGAAAVMAIAAGCDALLLCRDQDHQAQARAALVDAGERDPALRAMIGRAAERIRAAKAAHQRRQQELPRPNLDVLGCAAHQALADKLAAGAD